jgi:hypothetical protein
MRRFAFFLCIGIIQTCLVLGNDIEPKDLESRVVDLALDQKKPPVIKVGTRNITTIEFPAKIEAMEGYGFFIPSKETPVPPEGALFQISYNGNGACGRIGDRSLTARPIRSLEPAEQAQAHERIHMFCRPLRAFRILWTASYPGLLGPNCKYLHSLCLLPEPGSNPPGQFCQRRVETVAPPETKN